jgi:hypothetical protein
MPRFLFFVLCYFQSFGFLPNAKHSSPNGFILSVALLTVPNVSLTWIYLRRNSPWHRRDGTNCSRSFSV